MLRNGRLNWTIFKRAPQYGVSGPNKAKAPQEKTGLPQIKKAQMKTKKKFERLFNAVNMAFAQKDYAFPDFIRRSTRDQYLEKRSKLKYSGLSSMQQTLVLETLRGQGAFKAIKTGDSKEATLREIVKQRKEQDLVNQKY